MEKNENKVEKISDEQGKDVSGGFVGKDYSKKYQAIYSELGIVHRKNLLGYDEYDIGGERIPYKFIKKLADEWLNELPSSGKTQEQNREDIKKWVNHLRDGIKSGDPQALAAIKEIRDDYS